MTETALFSLAVGISVLVLTLLYLWTNRKTPMMGQPDGVSGSPRGGTTSLTIRPRDAAPIA